MIVRFFKTIVDQHLWIALAASLLTSTTYANAGWENDFTYILFVFGSTLFTYHFLNLYSKFRLQHISGIKTQVIAALSGLIIALSALIISGFNFIFYAAIPAILVIIYIIPLIPSDINKTQTLLIPGRNVGWFKILLIAATWTITTYAIPHALHGSVFYTDEFIPGFLQRFTFIFGLTIPFDARDIQVDPQHFRTIAQRFGIKKSLVLASLLLFISGAIASFSYIKGTSNGADYLSYIITIIIAVFSILFIKNKNRYYYTGYIDGIMILPFILLQIINEIML